MQKLSLVFVCFLQDTLMLGADSYQTESEIASLLAEGNVPIGIGRDTKIRYQSEITISSMSLILKL